MQVEGEEEEEGSDSAEAGAGDEEGEGIRSGNEGDFAAGGLGEFRFFDDWLRLGGGIDGQGDVLKRRLAGMEHGGGAAALDFREHVGCEWGDHVHWVTFGEHEFPGALRLNVHAVAGGGG